MRLPQFMAAIGLLAALLLPNAAAAQRVAYAGETVNLRAGPGTQYPVVAKIATGSVVNVYGCIAGYKWCDAIVGGIRGWVNTNRLEFLYEGRRVLVPTFYTAFAAPVVTFEFGYWDRYYKDRPFYRERVRYGDRREIREERRDERNDARVERKDERQDRERCLDRGGTAKQCRQ